MKKYLPVFLFVVSLVAGFGVLRLLTGFSGSGDAVEVDWRLLGNLDYVTGKAVGELASLDGKFVRVPGFVVPLEDEARRVTEFLLVPSPQACIHVPAPPPNQMVHVLMPQGAENSFGPVWVYGTLRIQPKRHQYGESSFQMDGERLEPYRESN